MKYLFLGGLFIATAIGIFMFLKPFFEEAWETISGALEYFIPFISEGLTMMLGGFLDLYKAVFQGDFWGAVLAIWEIIKGFGFFLWGLLGTLFMVTLGLLGTALYKVADWAKDRWIAWWKGASPEEKVVKIGSAILAIAAAWFVWWKFTTTPVWIIGLILIAGYKLLTALAKSFGWFADGGTVSSPLQIVGERGPELVNLPKGSVVHSNANSKNMVGGGSTTVNVTVNATSTNDTELRRIADKVATIINREVNRSTSSSMSR
jgi:hypothetical protein